VAVAIESKWGGNDSAAAAASVPSAVTLRNVTATSPLYVARIFPLHIWIILPFVPFSKMLDCSPSPEDACAQDENPLSCGRGSVTP